jgi:hypothetical protein
MKLKVLSATRLRVTSPAHAAGTVDVRVTTPSGTSPVVTEDKFTYQAPPSSSAPTVTGISPVSGPEGGGTVVTVSGTDFVGATKVEFGSAAGTNLTIDSATQLRVTSPAGTGTVDVRVTTPSGTSPVLTEDKFTYHNGPTTHCGQLSQDEQWNSNSVNLITCSVIIPAGIELTLTPGAVVKAVPEAGLRIEQSGSLIAKGQESSPVTITTITDDSAGGDTNGDGTATTPQAGEWAGIYVDGADSRLSLEHVSVRFGGISASSPGPVTVADSSVSDGSGVGITTSSPVTITNTKVMNNNGAGIAVRQIGASATTVGGNTVSGVGIRNDYVFSGVGIHVGVENSDAPAPTVEDNEVTNAAKEAIVVAARHLLAGKLQGNAGSGSKLNVIALAGTLEDELTLPLPGLPVAAINADGQNSNLTVGSTATLRIGSGVTLKAIPGRWCFMCSDANKASITVQGKLIAAGTADQPVTITTITDDSAGGDTNGDGTATTPQAGEWAGIYVDDDGVIDADSMIIQFGTANIATSNNATVRINGGSLRHANIALSVSSGIVSFRGSIINSTDQNGYAIRACDWGTAACSVDAAYVDWGTPEGPFPSTQTGPLACGAVSVYPWKHNGETIYRFFGIPNCSGSVTPDIRLAEAQEGYNNTVSELEQACRQIEQACEQLREIQNCVSAAQQLAWSHVTVGGIAPAETPDVSSVLEPAGTWLQESELLDVRNKGQVMSFGAGVIEWVTLFNDLSAAYDTCSRQVIF